MDIVTLIAFTIAYAIAVIVPGPGVAAVVARALGGGFRSAFPMVLGILAGDLVYLVFALFGASLVALFAVLPPALIALVAGLGLMAPLANALSIAMRDEADRAAAVTAFAVTASGMAFFGIGSAFWGLVAGLAVIGLDRLRARA